MVRRRRSSISLLWIIIHFTLVSGNTLIQLDNTERTSSNNYRGKASRRRLKSSGHGKGTKRSNLWYRGFYSQSTPSSHSSSRSDSYDIRIQVLFPNKPDDKDDPATTLPQSPSPSQRPTKTPTQFPSTLPTMRPSIRPTPSPSQEPSSLSSESPTLPPSQNPSAIASASPTKTSSRSPTLFPDPTLHPSNAPSQLTSDGPTYSIIPSFSPSRAPSIVPSAEPSRSPSNIPSIMPSAIESDHPTSSISPSIAPSDTPSGIVSRSPSLSEPPSNTPTTIPSMLPSNDPSTGPSTNPPFETAAPTLLRDSQILPIFTLEYQLFDFVDPTETDLVELEALTRAYLRDHIFGAINGADALLDDFFTIYTDEQTDIGSLLINVSFESTAFYNPNSRETIPTNDLFQEVVNAFTGEELDEYLERVQSLPDSNTFAGAIQIFLISQLESQNQRSMVSVLLAGSTAILTVLFGFGFLRYGCQKNAKRQALKEFDNTVSMDSEIDSSNTQENSNYIMTNLRNPVEKPNEVKNRPQADCFLAAKRSAYSRPRMRNFSEDRKNQAWGGVCTDSN